MTVLQGSARPTCRLAAWAFVAAVTSTTSLACRGKPTENNAPAPSATASAAPLAPGASAEPPAPPGSTSPAETLRFSGTYEASAHRLDLPIARGGLPEWTADDPRRATGSGVIELEISGGQVSGEASGPLGHQRVTGSFESGKLFARLTASDGAAYSGTLVATQDGSRITGTVQASAGDSHSSRTATVALSRK